MVKDLNIKITQEQIEKLNLKYKLIDDEFYINLCKQHPIYTKIHTKIVSFKNILQDIENTKIYKKFSLLEIPIQIKILLSNIFHTNDFSKEIIQLLLLDIFKSKIYTYYLLIIEMKNLKIKYMNWVASKKIKHKNVIQKIIEDTCEKTNQYTKWWSNCKRIRRIHSK